jgi:hypothetical protein
LLGNDALDRQFRNTTKKLTKRARSDGIARVHGMANVQAEELVE